jgi:outer membrane protein, multidrug efflux system
MKSILIFSAILVAAAHAERPLFRPRESGPAAAPAVEVSPRYKNGASSANVLAGGDWWSAFGDAQLNRLLDRVASDNLDTLAAMARIEQARAVTGIARASLFPSITLNPAIQRARSSGTQRFPGFPGTIPTATLTTTAVPLDFGYELDVWGRIRGNIAAANADLDAVWAAREALTLALRAEVAGTWFSVRTLDAQRMVLRESVALRKTTLDLAQQRLKAGIGTDFDVARAEAEVATAEAELAMLAQRRPALESGLAVLTGQDPSRFSLAGDLAWKEAPRIPSIPAGVPAQLITRRPDVAAAERGLAAAGARIGVAEAAFKPTVKLGGQIGLLTSDVGDVFDKDSRTWNFGASFSLPVFDGGRNRASLSAAKAVAKEARAKFEQAVLSATADVESALGALRALEIRREAQLRAQASTARGASLARERYKSGTSSFLDVLEAERSALGAQLAVAALNGERLATTVQLIKALGGGWTLQQPR